MGRSEVLLMFNRLCLAIINAINAGPGGGRDPSTSSGTASNVTATAEKVHDILRNIAGPILTMLGSAAVIYAVVLGVQYAKAEDDGKRTELKKRVVNTVIGIAVMFVLAAMCLFIQWDAIIDDIFGYAW